VHRQGKKVLLESFNEIKLILLLSCVSLCQKMYVTLLISHLLSWYKIFISFKSNQLPFLFHVIQYKNIGYWDKLCITHKRTLFLSMKLRINFSDSLMHYVLCKKSVFQLLDSWFYIYWYCLSIKEIIDTILK